MRFWVLLLVQLLYSSATPIRRGPITLGPDADLSYTINIKEDWAKFDLNVYNKTILAKPNERAWVVFGFGEPSSGGYLGSDVVTIEFQVSVLNLCRFTDSFIPFTAYPLSESQDGADYFKIKEDKCQLNISWELVKCTRDVYTGSIHISMRRVLTAHNDQDRPLEPSVANIIYAYGTGAEIFALGIHRTKHIALYNFDGTLPVSTTPQFPKDAWGHQTISAAKYLIPKESTSFACTSLEGAVPVGHSLYIIALEPKLKANLGSVAVHSMTLYACPMFKQFPHLLETLQCGIKYIPRPATYCSDVLYRWTNGIGPFILPDDVGFLISDDNKYLVLETKYENPSAVDNIVDSSGVKFYYAKKRKHAAGSLLLGDTLGSLDGLSVKMNYHGVVSTLCPSDCTKEFDSRYPVMVFASSPQMGRYGRSIHTYKHTSAGHFLTRVSRVGFWSAESQWTHMLQPHVKILPGEQLSTTCFFDTRKRPDTIFGTGSDDELCIDTLFYYPRQSFKDVTGLPVLEGDLGHCGLSSPGSINGTLCGAKVLSAISNTPLKGAFSREENFGKEPNICYIKKTKPKPDAKPRSGQNQRKSACFPADSQVYLCDGCVISMKNLKFGDLVQSGSGSCSQVIAFSHRQTIGLHMFVSIIAGNFTIFASPGHLIYANGELVPASELGVGDILFDKESSPRTVSSVATVWKNGLFNPQTENGNIVVDGVIASCYTTSVAPSVAHALLSFLRSVATMLDLYIAALDNPLESLLSIAVI